MKKSKEVQLAIHTATYRTKHPLCLKKEAKKGSIASFKFEGEMQLQGEINSGI